ncbi:MAG: tripartite tricarboxylate transporter TctB family protein [Rhodobacteraceae bacterium]|nr:tripartite tricarboxylate transporter TctB family protein [Paracoccaceae bacterium]
MSADRISGIFFLLLGLAMYFVVNPAHIEAVEGGSLNPKTVPDIISLILALCGGLLVLKPTTHQVANLQNILRTAGYSLLLVAGLFAMSRFGFEYVAPLLAFAIMWFIGERRPFWLAFGAVGMPALIWFLVTQALGRALP